MGLAAMMAVAMGRKDAKPRLVSVTDTTVVREGITGRVEIWEGNFMPMIEPARRNAQIKPCAGCRVRVHEPVIVGGGLVSARRDTVLTPLVAEVVCDSMGHFSSPVKPGTYSVFVEENGGWYFNGWNGDGVQGAVTVLPDSVTEIIIKVTTKATF